MAQQLQKPQPEKRQTRRRFSWVIELVRNSLRYVSYKHHKEVASNLKAIYSATTEAEAELNLELSAEKWDQLYPNICKAWQA